MHFVVHQYAQHVNSAVTIRLAASNKKCFIIAHAGGSQAVARVISCVCEFVSVCPAV